MTLDEFKIHIATKMNGLDFIINLHKDKYIKCTLYLLTLMDIARTTDKYLKQIMKEVKIR